jgi:hypothetical protein
MKFIYHSLMLLMASFVGVNANAQTSIDNSKNTLNVISEFANKICSDPAYTGSITSESAGAKAKGELLSLIKKLIDAKVEIGADYKRQAYIGLLQKDLLEATKNATACRLTIVKDLSDRLLPKKAGTAVIQKAMPIKSQNILLQKIETPKDIKKESDFGKELSINKTPESFSKVLDKSHDIEKSSVNTSAAKNTSMPNNSIDSNESQTIQVRGEVRGAISAINGTSSGYRNDAILALLNSLPDNLNVNEITLMLGDEKTDYRADNLRLLLRKTKLNSLTSNKIYSILKNETASYRVDLIKMIYPYIKSPMNADDAVNILSSLTNSYRVDALNHIAPKIVKPLNNFEIDNILKDVSNPYKVDAIKALFK